MMRIVIKSVKGICAPTNKSAPTNKKILHSKRQHIKEKWVIINENVLQRKKVGCLSLASIAFVFHILLEYKYTSINYNVLIFT